MNAAADHDEAYAPALVAAAFDGPIDRAPEAHAYYDQRVDWMPVDGTLTISRG